MDCFGTMTFSVCGKLEFLRSEFLKSNFSEKCVIKSRKNILKNVKYYIYIFLARIIENEFSRKAISK